MAPQSLTSSTSSSVHILSSMDLVQELFFFTLLLSAMVIFTKEMVSNAKMDLQEHDQVQKINV